jgi:hypothetical protein
MVSSRSDLGYCRFRLEEDLSFIVLYYPLSNP